MRRAAPILCAVQVALGLVLALADCGACRRGPPLAWLAVAYYAALGVVSTIPRARELARFLSRWAFAVHLALVATMIRRGELCWICAACAAVSLGLLALSMCGDRRPAWRWGLEFLPLVLAAFAVVSALAPPPPPGIESSSVEMVVFRSDRCPHCVEFERDVVPRLSPDLKITYLDADRYDFVRFTPTIVIRGPGKHRVFEGVPPLEEIIEALK